jgi:hypothetical protein
MILSDNTKVLLPAGHFEQLERPPPSEYDPSLQGKH